MMMPNWLDTKTIVVLATVIGTAFVANYRLGQLERGQGKFSLSVASVEADLQQLKLRIVGVENDVEANAEKLEDRKEFMSKVERVLQENGEILIRQGMTLKQQNETLGKILKRLENDE